MKMKHCPNCGYDISNSTPSLQANDKPVTHEFINPRDNPYPTAGQIFEVVISEGDPNSCVGKYHGVIVGIRTGSTRFNNDLQYIRIRLFADRSDLPKIYAARLGKCLTPITTPLPLTNTVKPEETGVPVVQS